jgi:hypothetical protein
VTRALSFRTVSQTFDEPTRRREIHPVVDSSVKARLTVASDRPRSSASVDLEGITSPLRPA